MNKIFGFVFSWLVCSTAFGFTIFSESGITDYWQQSSPESKSKVDHTEWDKILDRYITTEKGINLFAYGLIAKDDQAALKDYLNYLQRIEVTGLNKASQFAFWINLYNALTVEVVLEHYPTDSILDISYGVLSSGPWKEELVEVEGMALSLDNIEHQILRPIFGDNRIHFAVNCASMGCPNLQPAAFTDENLESLLALGARQYVNHPRGVSFVDDELFLSSIFDWYGEDFGDDDREVIMALLPYADNDLKVKLAKFQSINEYQYDWSLNE